MKIASFNIQVFGRSKLRRPVMKVLCDVVRRFDVLAIQEVRRTTTASCRGLCNRLMRRGGSTTL